MAIDFFGLSQLRSYGRWLENILMVIMGVVSRKEIDCVFKASDDQGALFFNTLINGDGMFD